MILKQKKNFFFRKKNFFWIFFFVPPELKNAVLYDFDAFFLTLFQEIWKFQIFDRWVGGDTKSEKNQKSQK